jgi:hypothetical protein
MTKEFEDGEVKQEARDALATAFEGVGGMSKFIAWAKTHRSAFYSMYVKLLPMQVQTKVDVTHRDSEEARHKLEDAFKRLIASRREDLEREERDRAAGIFRDDEGVPVERGTEQYRLLQARYELDRKIDAARDGGRSSNDAGRAPLEQVTYSRVDTPGTRDVEAASTVAERASTIDESNSNPKSRNVQGGTSRGPRRDVTGYAHPVTAASRQPTTTEQFIEWSDNGGLSRSRWDNNQ